MDEQPPGDALRVGDRVRLLADSKSQPMTIAEMDGGKRAWCVGDDGGRVSLPLAALRKLVRRGFAAMSAEKQSEIASLGGRAAHAKGTAHKFDSAEAREAGRIGGKVAALSRSRGGHG